MIVYIFNNSIANNFHPPISKSFFFAKMTIYSESMGWSPIDCLLSPFLKRRPPIPSTWQHYYTACAPDQEPPTKYMSHKSSVSKYFCLREAPAFVKRSRIKKGGSSKLVNTFTARQSVRTRKCLQFSTALMENLQSLWKWQCTKKEHFLLSLGSLGPLKPSHKSAQTPPDFFCCQISCLDNASHHHCLGRNMICGTAMSHHLTWFSLS